MRCTCFFNEILGPLYPRLPHFVFLIPDQRIPIFKLNNTKSSSTDSEFRKKTKKLFYGLPLSREANPVTILVPSSLNTLRLHLRLPHRCRRHRLNLIGFRLRWHFLTKTQLQLIAIALHRHRVTVGHRFWHRDGDDNLHRGGRGLLLLLPNTSRACNRASSTQERASLSS